MLVVIVVVLLKLDEGLVDVSKGCNQCCHTAYDAHQAPRDLQMLLGSVKCVLLYPVVRASLAGAEVPPPLTDCIF